MFQELDDNLKAMNAEVLKIQNAVVHINQSKEAAQQVVQTSKNMQTAFGSHLENVTNSVESILEPHQKLIKATEQLTKTINAIDFPARLTQQENEIQLLKNTISELNFPTRFRRQENEFQMLRNILFVLGGLIVFSTFIIILVLKK